VQWRRVRRYMEDESGAGQAEVPLYGCDANRTGYVILVECHCFCTGCSLKLRLVAKQHLFVCSTIISDLRCDYLIVLQWRAGGRVNMGATVTLRIKNIGVGNPSVAGRRMAELRCFGGALWRGSHCVISSRSRCDKRGPVLALHILALGFPLLECGPSGPRARAQVEGAILTNKR
jgi:hypothetical protein